MYHSISNEDDRRIHPYYKTNTKPEVFADHMAFLHKNYYQVISISDAVKYLVADGTHKKKYAVITFDDGYHDFYESAFPVLKKFNFPATVFLPTRFIDERRLKFNGRECLNWDEIRKLSSQDIIFGSHTVSHPKLIFLKEEGLEHELSQSKTNIEDNIGKSIESFSYPYAFPERNRKFVKSLRNILIKCGYATGVSTSIGTETKKADQLFLKRIPLNSDDDDHFLKAKLEGAYDWLHRPQLLIKSLKTKMPNRD
jgi:peptidoglycan/xylan/chitin deacetylase (PgdA/CDA1 family)